MQASLGWLDRTAAFEGPIFRGVVFALREAIAAGDLTPGERLPAQRRAAEYLDVDFTTITRAYDLAKTEGLVQSATGRGTFVRASAPQNEFTAPVDLSMNVPPPPAGLSFAALLAQATGDILKRTDVASLMAYHAGAPAPGEYAAAQAFMEPFLGGVERDRIVVASGAQTVLAALFLQRPRLSRTLIVDPLTYPGVLSAANDFGLEVISVESDDEGMAPAGLQTALATHEHAFVYICPTLQNPIGRSLSLARRRDLARVIAGSPHAILIEDDAYGRLTPAPTAAIASLVPEQSYYIATVSKCLSPGLRIAYVAAPNRNASQTLSLALRTLTMMPAPLSQAIVTQWVREGRADQIIRAVQFEALARRSIAAEIFPNSASEMQSLHIWVDLPAGRDERDVRLAAHARGLSLVTSPSFSAGVSTPAGVRLSLGGAKSRDALRRGLRLAAETINADLPLMRGA